MKKKLAIILAALLLAAPACVRAAENGGKAGATKAESLTETATENHVTVTVTYKNPEDWRPVFEVTMDSRFVNLKNVEPGDVSILYDDMGGVYRPTEVTAEGENDEHHKKALLKFGQANASAAGSFRLTVQRVADVGIRTFKFATRKNLTGSGF